MEVIINLSMRVTNILFRCELEFKKYGKMITKSSSKYLKIVDCSSTDGKNDGIL